MATRRLSPDPRPWGRGDTRAPSDRRPRSAATAGCGSFSPDVVGWASSSFLVAVSCTTGSHRTHSATSTASRRTSAKAQWTTC